MQGRQILEFLDESGWKDLTGKMELFDSSKKITDGGNENFSGVWYRWSDVSIGEPGNGVTDARGGRGCGENMVGSIVGKCWTQVETRDAMTSPRSSIFGRFVDDDCSASRGNRMCAEIELRTGESVMRRYSWVRMPG